MCVRVRVRTRVRVRGVLRHDDDDAAGRSFLSLCVIYIYKYSHNVQYVRCMRITVRTLLTYHPPVTHPSTRPPTDQPRVRVAWPTALHRQPAITHRSRFPRAETAWQRPHGRKNQNPGDGRRQRLETAASILNK